MPSIFASHDMYSSVAMVGPFLYFMDMTFYFCLAPPSVLTFDDQLGLAVEFDCVIIEISFSP